MTDQTMHALMDVYRSDLNDRDNEIASLTMQLDSQRDRADRLGRDKDQTERLKQNADERARANLVRANELEEQVAKQNDVNQSLNIELGTERQANTEARDALRRILDIVGGTLVLPIDEKLVAIRDILYEHGYHDHVHVAHVPPKDPSDAPPDDGA
ncbi:hypothetical protein SEA_DELIAN_81 [Gordonia phage Delian]|uniref:hypothetical protein n=1 Tax=Gordonia phage CaptainKirk2 TaxID=1887643 RepID=UPI00084EE318|nr:hypothetical protein BIZ76_gp78 [Gordonia phage CaptainKirk2]AOE44021.1 hypothetical protein SEA_CAPTAINKIRK2_78 [Gordonia phage CaptainKirk2]QDH85399.1 hypothetical protein SEA_MINTFEN_78 [Gordonia phage MintFen]QGH78001.1 hypothetical protein SEA_DELIAN_81 [Gordonia phage Delian]